MADFYYLSEVAPGEFDPQELPEALKNTCLSLVEPEKDLLIVHIKSAVDVEVAQNVATDLSYKLPEKQIVVLLGDLDIRWLIPTKAPNFCEQFSL